MVLCHAAAAQEPSRADQVKAVFLFNFTQFVTWPHGSFPAPTSPFVIGIVGTNPFGNFLKKVVENEKVEGHPIAVQHFTGIKDVRNCHLLFVNVQNPAEAIEELNQRGVLTVGDSADFARSGGMIGFYVENNKIRLQINTRSARAANLSISSKLLRLAAVVDN
jgi:hypothetical protein